MLFQSLSSASLPEILVATDCLLVLNTNWSQDFVAMATVHVCVCVCVCVCVRVRA